MSEQANFDRWEHEVFGHLIPGDLPSQPESGEDPITFAKRLQSIIAIYPVEDQYLVGKDALKILGDNYSYEIIGRRLSVHALRGLIYSDQAAMNVGMFTQPFRATGFWAPFSLATLPTESTISLQMAMPTVCEDSSRPNGELEIGLPLQIPILGIDEHHID